MINHRKNWLVALLAVVAVAVLPLGAAAKSSSGAKSFHGKVAAVSTAGKTFRITRADGTSLTFRVTRATIFERLGGRLSALRVGRAVEVKATRADGRWTARKVEADDRADHDAGDDHGAGADDGAGHDVGARFCVGAPAGLRRRGPRHCGAAGGARS
jgi:hypothetical protein